MIHHKKLCLGIFWAGWIGDALSEVVTQPGAEVACHWRGSL